MEMSDSIKLTLPDGSVIHVFLFQSYIVSENFLV